ncbi:hypothetical protein K0T92_24035 [Paenibacillus oenotherae]|uniref:Uncharacterized protein n=1 Tax=Paenibacillus oenotherae TaxID=1435645 RepID=A0ABS7DCW7_9BACL|nr:hypothetical protein [Paenibacillus oenotherae]MBW7477784.1 hypothetical protein [Paenibacillus oenotherae]
MRKLSIALVCLFLLGGAFSAFPAGVAAAGAALKPVKAFTKGEQYMILTFPERLTAEHQYVPLLKSGFSIDLPGYSVTLATASGSEVVLFLNKPLVGVDSVNIHIDQGVVRSVDGHAHNPTINGFKMITPQGKLALKQTLDPSGAGTTIQSVVKYLQAHPGGNIVGASGIDSADVRYLLSLMDLGEVNKDELMDAIEWARQYTDSTRGTAEARQELAGKMAAAQAVADQASATQREVDIAGVELQNGVNHFIQLLSTYTPPVMLSQPVSIIPKAGTMIADNIINEAEIQSIQGPNQPLSAFDPQFVVTLQKNPYNTAEYAAGDVIHVILGQSGVDLAYTLSASDIEAINDNIGPSEHAAVTIDARSFFLNPALGDEEFTPRVYVERAGQTISSMPRSAAHAVTVSRNPVILSHSTGYVEIGSPVTAAISKAGTVYLVPAEAVINSEADLQAQSYSEATAAAANETVSLSTDGTSIGSSYKLYAVDHSGQLSAPSAAVTITAAPANYLNARGTHPHVEVDGNIVYVPAGMDAAALKSHLVTTYSFDVVPSEADLTPVGGTEIVTNAMKVAVNGEALELFDIRIQKAAASFSDIIDALSEYGIDAIKLTADIVDTSAVMEIEYWVNFRSSVPHSLTVGGLRIEEDAVVTKDDTVTVIADVGSDDDRLAGAVAYNSIADEVLMDTRAGFIAGPLRRSESNPEIYVNPINIAVIGDLDGWYNASSDSSIGKIYVAADIPTAVEIIIPSHPLNLYGDNRVLTGYPITGTLNGTLSGVTITTP